MAQAKAGEWWEDEVCSMYSFPWQATMSSEPTAEGEEPFWNVVDAVGQVICPALNESEARFIAARVNEHDELVAALMAALPYLEPVGFDRFNQDAQRVYEQTRAALARVQGTSGS